MVGWAISSFVEPSPPIMTTTSVAFFSARANALSTAACATSNFSSAKPARRASELVATSACTSIPYFSKRCCSRATTSARGRAGRHSTRITCASVPVDWPRAPICEFRESKVRKPRMGKNRVIVRLSSRQDCRYRQARKRAGVLPGPRLSRPEGAVRLERKLQAKLNGATAAGTDDRVRGGHVRCRAGTTKASRAGHGRIVVPPTVLPSIGIREVRVVEDVEEFAAELQIVALANRPVFHHRKVHVAVSKIAEGVSSHGSECADRRGQHHAVAHHIAAPVVQGGCVASHLPSVQGRGLRRAQRVTGSRKPRHSRGNRGLEAGGVAEEIPAVYQLARAAHVRARIDRTPRLCAIHDDDGIHLPTFQHFRK